MVIGRNQSTNIDSIYLTVFMSHNLIRAMTMAIEDRSLYSYLFNIHTIGMVLEALGDM